MRGVVGVVVTMLFSRLLGLSIISSTLSTLLDAGNHNLAGDTQQTARGGPAPEYVEAENMVIIWLSYWGSKNVS